MATQPPPPQPKPVPPDTPKDKAHYVKIVQHSQLFYWWPVWLVGFILAAISWFSDGHMAVLPGNAVVETSSEGYTIQVPGTPPNLPKDAAGKPVAVKVNDWASSPYPVHMASNKSLGVVWAITLLLVIFITNVPLRGMWSVVVLVSIVLLSVILYLAQVWETIFEWFSFLRIHINTGGYFFISAVLFILWVVTVFLFDQQTYWVFIPGQLRIHEAIGGGEVAYDTRGMMTEKHRDDLFRHWVLGLGTGDLTVRTSGAQQKEFRIQNVVWVGHKLALIQKMQAEFQMVIQK